MEKHRLSYHKEMGFTIVELMIVIAIVGILVSIASVSYSKFTRRSEVTQLARDFEAALTSAKHHARTSGRTISVCGTEEIQKDNPTCLTTIANFNNGSTSETLGWVVFYDADANDTISTGDKVFKKVPLSYRRARMIWSNATMPIDITPRNTIGTGGTLCVYSFSGTQQTACSDNVATQPLNEDTFERRVSLTGLGNITFLQ